MLLTKTQYNVGLIGIAGKRPVVRGIIAGRGIVHINNYAGILGVISYRTGRKLMFNPETEKLIQDPEADTLLTGKYHAPFIMPDKV